MDTPIKFYQTGTFTVGNRLLAENQRSVQANMERTNSLNSGHRACQGCGEALGARYAIDAAKIWYETEPSSMQALQALSLWGAEMLTARKKSPTKPPIGFIGEGANGPVTPEAVPAVTEKPVTTAKAEPASPGMQPVEEQIGRTAEVQSRGEEAQGSGEAGKRESKGAGEKGTKGGGDERVTELAPVPVIPPVVNRPEPEASRPPVPSQAPKTPEAVAEPSRAATESAPVSQQAPAPPAPITQALAKEPARDPPRTRAGHSC